MRYLLISFFIHILVINFVWVGFFVPKGFEQNSFTYLGDLFPVAEDASHGNSSEGKSKVLDVTVFDEPSAAFSAAWLKMRQVDKPR